MNDKAEETPDTEGLDQWTNTVGSDDELDALWAGLLAAIADAEPENLAARLGQHFATLGARSRRTTEGLILAVTSATAAEQPAWEDWRVVLHRHFARDERMDLALAAAILREWQKEARMPDWHSLPDQVTERVFASYIRDMRNLLDLLGKPEKAAAAAAGLVALTSELFDVAIALEAPRAEELQHSPEATAMLRDIERSLSEARESLRPPLAQNLIKAQALMEVTLRQLEIGTSVVH